MLAHFFAPRVCRICGCALAKGEEEMCLGCNLDMPRTGVHLQPFNIIHQRLGHGCPVDRAAGWFYYTRQSPYAQMLITAKYANQPALARRLGKICAEELMRDGFFQGIDAIVPMPMYWFKRLRRGYNQAYEICVGISQATGLPIVEALKATRSHGILSRTKTSRERYAAISGTLALGSTSITGLHLLFVDDIITTGASASEAIRTLHTASPASISALSLGLTRLS